jgi:FlaA1/EpsC-like NDP-sugar epimerase
VIVIGGLSATVSILLLRVLMAVIGIRTVRNPFAKIVRTLIISDEEEFIRIRDLISRSGKKYEIAGRVGINPDDLGQDVLGTLHQVKEIIRMNHITQVVFSTRELSASQIIESMQLVSECNIDVRIAPTGGNLLIGSRSASSYVQPCSGSDGSL